MNIHSLSIQILTIGLGATALMDLWLVMIKRLGLPTQSFALVGRWLGHVIKGNWHNPSIAKSPPVRGELELGWIAHYTLGVLFAMLLVLLLGQEWLKAPTPLPAVIFGLLTVLIPWLIVQPAMGAGVMSSKTQHPLKSCIRNLLNHAVFGFGLYVSALLYQVLCVDLIQF